MHDKVDLFHFYGHLLSVDASNMFAHSPKPFKINKFSCQINGKHCANLNWVCVCVCVTFERIHQLAIFKVVQKKNAYPKLPQKG